jgi:hypothetical protein
MRKSPAFTGARLRLIRGAPPRMHFLFWSTIPLGISKIRRMSYTLSGSGHSGNWRRRKPVAEKIKSKAQSGGVNISGGNVDVKGDIVGRDKITAIRHGLNAEELTELAGQFALINRRIDARPKEDEADKAKLKEAIAQIEREVKKGEAADPGTVERWLRFLAGMADDIFQVTAAALANPVAGAAKAVQLIAQKAKREYRP